MPVPVISVPQMRQWEDASWQAGRSAATVIKNVGRLIAHRALQLTRPGDFIVILAGRGHNGDDARAARRHLQQRKVALINALDPKAASREFSVVVKSPQRRPRPMLVIDGLFGIGLNRPLEGAWKNLIDAVNQSCLRVLSIDVPSGLNADNGHVEGAAIRAGVTLTVAAPKRGLLAAGDFVGRLETLPDIGLIPCPLSSELNWTLPEDFANWPPPRLADSNKGSFGHLTIIAGSLGFHGAAVLATRGALRAQPGLVTVEPQPSVYVPVASQLQAAMVRPWHPAQPPPPNASAILFGPGLAARRIPPSLKKQLLSLWKTFPGPMVVDASALDWLEPGAAPAQAIRVITPHPGEAGRMLGIATGTIQADRLAALRRLSRRLAHCYVVLKGHHTIVGSVEGPVFVNPSGNAFLAQGGSGDLLGGYLAGLLAQPACQKDPLTTIRYAVWQHGAAADELLLRQSNMTVEDLASQLGLATPIPLDIKPEN